MITQSSKGFEKKKGMCSLKQANSYLFISGLKNNSLFYTGMKVSCAAGGCVNQLELYEVLENNFVKEELLLGETGGKKRISKTERIQTFAVHQSLEERRTSEESILWVDVERHGCARDHPDEKGLQSEPLIFSLRLFCWILIAIMALIWLIVNQQQSVNAAAIKIKSNLPRTVPTNWKSFSTEQKQETISEFHCVEDALFP